MASLLCVATIAIAAPIALAAPPVQPLQPPLYSFDAASPKVLDGLVNSDAILELNFPDPRELVGGLALGLGQVGDEINALSGNASALAPTQPFVILFSVDRDTIGLAPPDPLLAAQNLPYNVVDQVLRGHAPGDQFMTLDLFTRAGGPMIPIAGGGGNNTQTRNNGDEGGTDFAARPDTSSEQMSSDPRDNVNSMTNTEPPPSAVAGNTMLGAVYFSLSETSPSLANLPGPEASGANLFFNPSPLNVAGVNSLFASRQELNLDVADDISGLIVFDDNGDGMFNGTDQILLTLAPGSPSLATIAGPGKAASPADVFMVSPLQLPQVFAPAFLLGLGDPLDAVDALDFFPCDDAEVCASLHAIQRLAIPTVSEWGMIGMTLLLLAAGTVLFRSRRNAARAAA